MLGFKTSKPLAKPGRGQFYAINSLNIAYLQIHKCACSSIAYYISVLDRAEVKKPIWQPDHNNFDLITPDFREVKDYFTFTFVRNPYKRFYSFYKNWIVNPPKTRVLEVYAKHGVYANMPFDECVRRITKIKDSSDLEHHAAPMHEFLFHKGALKLNFVGKLENLDTDWVVIQKYCGTDKPLMSRNKKPSSASPYNEETRERVYRFYQQDFELLDYDPNDF